jgi:hypothetical protein
MGMGRAAGSAGRLELAMGLVIGVAVALLAASGVRQHDPAGGGLSSREADCASLMIVMNPAGSTFDLLAVQELRNAGVRILYVATAPDRSPQRRTLACGFEDDAGAFGGSGTLAAVRVDDVPLGPVRLALLKRFWLESGAAATAALPAGAPQRMPPAPAPDWLTSERPGPRY